MAKKPKPKRIRRCPRCSSSTDHESGICGTCRRLDQGNSVSLMFDLGKRLAAVETRLDEIERKE